MEASPAPTLRPAATLVIFRQPHAAHLPELLMVERAGTMRFAAGATVFPGGKLDPQDFELAQTMAPDRIDDAAGRIAAIRETLEETGLALGFANRMDGALAARARALLQSDMGMGAMLDSLALSLDLDALTPYARWRRETVGGFDTRFYLADLGTGAVDLMVDATENTRLFWCTAEECLKAATQGRLRIILPTLLNLTRIAQYTGFAQARADALAHPVVAITARREMRDGREWVTIPDGLGYPVTALPSDEVLRG